MRTFIAVEIPFNERIGDLQRSITGRHKAVERENMHITLKFLGEVSEKKIEEIKKVVENCKVSPFKIKLHGVGFFPSEKYIKVVWIGVKNGEEIVGMMKCIDQHLQSMGFKRERNYVPHLTVARAKGKISIENIEKFRNSEFGEVEIKEIKIKKSTLTDKGPIYEDLFVIQL